MTRKNTERRRKALYRKALRVLSRRLGEPDLVLADIAEDVDCSPRQLQRVLSEQGGSAFRSTLLAIRMERARVLLSRKPNPLPISKAAPLVGYRQASGFRQAFFRYWGINPSEVQPEPPEYGLPPGYQRPGQGPGSAV